MATMFSSVKPSVSFPADIRFLVIKSVLLYGLLACVYGAAWNAAAGTAGNSVKRTQRDSTPPDDKEFPWEVKLRSLAALRFSGVLLDSSWVLTAASCFQGNYLQPNNYNIELYNNEDISSKASPLSTSPFHTTSSSLSSSSLSSSSSSSSSMSSSSSAIAHHSDQSIYVESFYLYGLYSEGQTRHNLALVHLHDNVTSRSVFADVIGPRDDVSGEDCVTVGWGSNVTGEPVKPRIRKWSVMNNTLCSRHYNVTVHPDELCAHLTDTPTGVCTGDIGAPLLCRTNATWTVKGLVTHAWRCHDDDQDPQPARFLNVQHYIPFVQKRGNFKDRQSFLGPDS